MYLEQELVFELGLEVFEFKKNVPKLKLPKTFMQKTY
jgi:hypothetical protein